MDNESSEGSVNGHDSEPDDQELSEYDMNPLQQYSEAADSV